MRNIYTYIRIIILSFIILSGGQISAQITGISLEDIWASPKYFAQGAEAIRWMKNDEQFSRLESKQGKISLNIYWVNTNGLHETVLEDSLLVEAGSGNKIQISDYIFNEDETLLMILAEPEALYRHSEATKVFVFDRKEKKMHTLFEGKKVYSPTFSPVGNKIAFVYENNIYVADPLKGRLEQITKDGKNNKIINGMCDWVYEEEFTFTRAFEWSYDGQKIAWIRFDEGVVPEYGMDVYSGLYPERQTFKYPKAGEANAQVSVHVWDFNKKKKTDIDAGTETDQYIPRIAWTRSSNQLMLLRMNRLQNALDFLLADAQSGKSRILMTEKSNAWVDIQEQMNINLYFLKSGKHFTWISEKDGYTHIYMYDLEQGNETRITQGNWDVTEFYGIDEARGFIYFAAADRSPMERHLFSIQMDGSKLKSLTEVSGTHTADFSTAFNYYVHTYSDYKTPYIITLRKNDGTEVKVLEKNEVLQKRLSEMHLHEKKFIRIPNEAGDEMNAWIIYPANFDLSRQYPVLMYVYGGPGSQTVKNAWEGPNAFWYQMIADKGYVIVSVDNRGTGSRGSAFKMSTYKQLGKYETEDQIAAARWISSQSWADAERIGIWGWSFGGYVTALCLTKGEGIFKSGISVAPVTNWKFYDTIYTERFLQTPQLNPGGYEDNSPVNFAKNFKGRYLLIHGSADDNVHLQNTMEFSQALIKAGKDFQMFIYPDRNHSIYGPGVRLHLYRMMTKFIEENL